MKILAFETSCDDTAVALVESGTNIIAQKRVSQTDHEAWGGVVPEIAARLHAENWYAVLENVLSDANIKIKDIDSLAVTQGPGLQTSLLTGTTAASFLSLCYQKPLIPVHHIHGHLCSIYLERTQDDIKFPSLVLTVSGGHTNLYWWHSPTNFESLGKTLDDACGEAFDKLAKMLGLGYPGGPVVSQRATLGNRLSFDLPRIYLEPDSLDFSFSGLKAACRRIIDEQAKITNTFINNICASFELAVLRIFKKKIERAIAKHPNAMQLHFVGGVSANTYLRSELSSFLQQYGICLLTPSKIEYSTDNAAMIGAAAYFLQAKDPSCAKVQMVEANPRLIMKN